MRALVNKAKQYGITHIAFGDLHLQNIRDYRVQMHEGTGIIPIFPIWTSPEKSLSLANEMIKSGVRAVVLTTDLKKIPEHFAGRMYDENFLSDLPVDVDPLGEFGEFHTLAIDGPAFRYPLPILVKERVFRDNMVFTEVELDETSTEVVINEDGDRRRMPYPIPMADIEILIDDAAVEELVSVQEREDLALLTEMGNM
eukprot:gene4425-5849_t